MRDRDARVGRPGDGRGNARDNHQGQSGRRQRLGFLCPPPKEKWIALGQIVGKLTRVEGSQKYLTVQVSQPVMVPNVGGSTYVRVNQTAEDRRAAALAAMGVKA